MALASELGLPVPSATVEIADDPVVALFQMSAAAPLGPADRYDVLAAPGSRARLDLVAELLDVQSEMLTAQIGMGDPGGSFDERVRRGSRGALVRSSRSSTAARLSKGTAWPPP